LRRLGVACPAAYFQFPGEDANRATIGSGSALTDAYDVAVGTDGRGYIVVKNGSTSRVIASDIGVLQYP
jgi:hypothetical protein